MRPGKNAAIKREGLCDTDTSGQNRDLTVCLLPSTVAGFNAEF